MSDASATTDRLFSLQDVSVSYGSDPVLRNLTLEIEPGEHVALYGQSGAGKTTLLRKLYELRPDVSALIHQDYALVPQLPAYNNVFAGRLDQNTRLRNFRNLLKPDAGDRAAVESICEDVGLAGFVDTPISELSGGQQQRVAVARAIYGGASVILADEPVAAVDPEQSLAILDILKAAADTVIVALHDVDLGLETFTRAIGLRDGQVAFDLAASEVTQDHLQGLYRPC